GGLDRLRSRDAGVSALLGLGPLEIVLVGGRVLVGRRVGAGRVVTGGVVGRRVGGVGSLVVPVGGGAEHGTQHLCGRTRTVRRGVGGFRVGLRRRRCGIGSGSGV